MQNTNPRTLRAAQNSKSNISSSTAYGHTPGSIGLRGWHPPRAHMFTSNTASTNSFSTIVPTSHASVSPTSDSELHGQCDVLAQPRLAHRTSNSPLNVRKTRENLRTGYLNDVAVPSGSSVSDFSYNKHHSVQPLQEIQNLGRDESARPSSRNTRFSWESNSIHLTTVIEQSPAKRISIESDKSEQKSAPSLSRKLSVRKRVVSRVKGGLLSRSRSSSKVPLRTEDDVAISCSASEHERQGDVFTPHLLTSDSAQSLVSLLPAEDFISTPDLLTALNLKHREVLIGSDGSFPSPSQELEPSPSPSPEKTPRADRKSTRSSKPHFVTSQADLSMLHINLSVTPAWSTLDLADEATIWAMIKAEASVGSDSKFTADMNNVNLPASDQHIGKVHKPLDIIVFIDNSPFVSPLALRSISDFTRRLCNLLQDDRDRLAVFCTSCVHESQCLATNHGCQLYCLQKPDAASLAIEVAELLVGKVLTPPSAAKISAMMQHAITSAITSLEGTFDSVTHGFVLSPLPQRCASMFRDVVSWPVHQIQVGYAYQAPTSQDRPQATGWCFEWNTANDNVLEALVQSAREEPCIQELSHVRVSINSAEPCRVERLLTPPRKATLHPGQCTTLFAKVRVPSVVPQTTSGPASLEGLLRGLQETLGSLKTELFKADVRYRHSLLPLATELRVEQACELVRTNRSSQWGTIRGQEDQDGLEVEIEKARFAARNYPPNIAIRILHKKFGKFWSGNDGPPVLQHLREELEFQQTISTKLSREVVRSSATARQFQDSKRTRNITLQSADAEALQVYNTAPSTPTPEENGTTIATPVDKSHIDYEPRPDSLVVQDEARRIWRHMRRHSRTSGISSTSEASSRTSSGVQQAYQQPRRRGSQESVMERMAAADIRVHEIRLKAIQNKRSVGAETLRDFSMMQQHDDVADEVGYEACAPWL
ncbi:hypothetical protein E4T38_00869 [Aureobasidium subglaciale]|nr:hypothetical protein E4T38_00869 [Aureobasidium subglaciale]KAI5230659.1 hypothetical protein E4T40_00870 [Aureobasidium subglaciale]KAI5233820.1 hypothetical protein E4T41_00868 [Aureobasidium subglaciale]KAI5267210.1 hypothetical protein E4T46_00868 [Aureobasidium subglaciale]